jgi:hypothetical protein
MAAAAWESSDDSSIIRIIFLKEESAGTAGIALKEELIGSSIRRKSYPARPIFQCLNTLPPHVYLIPY